MLYTDQYAKVLLFSRQEAERLRSSSIEPEHMMLGLLRQNENIAVEIMQKAGVDFAVIKNELEEPFRQLTLDVGDTIELSPEGKQVKRFSELEARGLGADMVGAEHLFLALLRKCEYTTDRPGKAFLDLRRCGIHYRRVYNMLKLNKTRMGFAFPDEEDDNEENPPMGSRTSRPEPVLPNGEKKVNKGGDTPALDAFGTDITKQAAEDKLDPVVGREAEIERIVQILCRRKKNNPVLIGDPGVGKSAIVEGLAQRIADGRISGVLYGKRIVSLDLAGMVAGTKYRGQFEERIKAVLGELKSHRDIILYIDEIHTLVGAGSASGTLDAANMLKPALSSGELQCIGATTLDEYRKSIEKDGALERRFQKVIVEPTGEEDTRTILGNIAARYEKHHNVHYTPESLDACVRLTQRYVSDRVFPDKAIDALDEAGARKHVANFEPPVVVRELEQRIAEIRQQKDVVLHEQNYEQAVNLRDQERELQAQLDYEIKRWQQEGSMKPLEVTEEDVSAVVSLMSGIPVQRVAQSESQRLLNLEDELNQSVIGQGSAVSAVARAIRLGRLGLKDPNRPIGSFIFLGPTGVGKTHLAQSLARSLFGSADAMIRVDMSEYMEKFSVSRLIGAPPGYVGYDEGGQLTERVRRRPYSIVLLDEIEKAHADVFNLLLQVMDEGRLTDSIGRRIDFRNTIIIMTSNAGSRQLKDFGRGVGFHTDDEPVEAGGYRQSVVRKALNRTFSPEFLNRVDEIVTFDALDKASIRRIVDLQLSGLISRLAEKNIRLTLTEQAVDFLAEQGYDPQYGARPLRRAIQRNVEDPLAEMLLLNERFATHGGTLTADCRDGKICFEETKLSTIL